MNDLEDMLRKKKECLKWLLDNQGESKEAYVHLTQIGEIGFEVEKVNNGTNHVEYVTITNLYINLYIQQVNTRSVA